MRKLLIGKHGSRLIKLFVSYWHIKIENTFIDFNMIYDMFSVFVSYYFSTSAWVWDVSVNRLLSIIYALLASHQTIDSPWRRFTPSSLCPHDDGTCRPGGNHCSRYPGTPSLTHWGRVTHICVDKLTIIGSENGLSPGRRQAIIWTNANGPLGTHFSEIFIGIQAFSFKKTRLKMSSAKWRPFCLGLSVLNQVTVIISRSGTVYVDFICSISNSLGTSDACMCHHWFR